MEESVFCYLTCPMPEHAQAAAELLCCVPDPDQGWQDAPGTLGHCCRSRRLVRPGHDPAHGGQHSDRQLGSLLWRRSGEWTCKHPPALHEVGGISLTWALPGQKRRSSCESERVCYPGSRRILGSGSKPPKQRWLEVCQPSWKVGLYTCSHTCGYQ